MGQESLWCDACDGWVHCIIATRKKKVLTHWGRVMHIFVGKLTNIDSDNGLAPQRRQAIIWTNVGILLIEPLGTNFSEFLIRIHTFSFKKIHLKMSSGKWRPFCVGLNVLTLYTPTQWNWVAGGRLYWIHLVCPSLCLSICQSVNAMTCKALVDGMFPRASLQFAFGFQCQISCAYTPSHCLETYWLLCWKNVNINESY